MIEAIEGTTAAATELSERKVNEKSVAEKISEAIASGEIDDSRVMNVEEEEDKESVIEKDQIEEMETSPVNVAENGQKKNI